MKTEKIVLSFIAVLAGLLVAGVAFYVYQSTKIIKPAKKIISQVLPAPIPKINNSLVIESPSDESVVSSKVVTVSGKTLPDTTIIISSDAADQVAISASDGNFSTTITINDGQNQLYIEAIKKNGETIKTTRTVTYSTENF